MKRIIKLRAWAKTVKVMHPNWFVTSDENGAYVLMQFTGLLDRNGKEIYENDVVQIKHAGSTKRLKVVKWNTKSAGWNIRQDRLSEVVSHEVIGNVYSNPELLNK